MAYVLVRVLAVVSAWTACLFAGSAQAAIAIDNTSSSYASSATLTMSHTTASGSDRLLLVSVVTGSSTTSSSDATTVSSVTYGGTPLTVVGTVVEEGNRVRAYIFRLIAPPVGTANVVVTQGASRPLYVGATTFTGVDQSTPLGTFASNSVGTPVGVLGGANSAALTGIASATNQLVFDVVGVDSDGSTLTLSPGAGQAARWTRNDSTLGVGGSSTKAGAASVDLTWTWNPVEAQQYVIGAVSIIPLAYSISGRVFEDVNYGGGAGRSFAAAGGGSGRDNARVELYNSGGSFVGFTTTSGGGNYSFTGLGAGTYTVRVVNVSVGSARSGYVAGTHLAVQTFRTNGLTGTVGTADPIETCINA